MAAKKKGGIKEFVIEARRELVERSVWPSRDQVMEQTIVVVATLTVVSLALWVMDSVAYATVSRVLDAESVLGLLSSKFMLVLFGIAFVVFVVYVILRSRTRKY